MVVVSFEGRSGTPMVSGISIRKAPKLPVTSQPIICNNCASVQEISFIQNRGQNAKFLAKYEKKIQELTAQCKAMSDECHDAWMSQKTKNDQLKELKMEFNNKLFQIENLELTVELQMDKLKNVTQMYEHSRKKWITTMVGLDEKVVKIGLFASPCFRIFLAFRWEEEICNNCFSSFSFVFNPSFCCLSPPTPVLMFVHFFIIVF
ncbi:hypothetical protein KSP39_PZI005935 [Platanthera zijinensis]|uniref:Uncharacterized protein n=1 Tax=Platanthera zijinensis TaxID=2320716 RepID=A0AAP0BVR4_9ASPA